MNRDRKCQRVDMKDRYESIRDVAFPEYTFQNAKKCTLNCQHY